MTSWTIAATLLCAGCGNYSTEDLEFYAALPQREDLNASVPSGGAAGALTAAATADCTALGKADVWLQAKPTSDNWNTGIGFVISLIDAVREYPPSWRKHEETYDERGWGPFPAEKHPGREIRVIIRRDYPPALAGEPRYAYAFQARVEGTVIFTDLVTGSFQGPSSAQGKGRVDLDFEAFYALGMASSDTPHGTLPIKYDRTDEPGKLFLELTRDGFGMPQFAYAYRGWRDGGGKFAYRYVDLATVRTFTVVASYDSSGAGKGALTVTTPFGSGYVRQCWGADACLLFVDDAANLVGGTRGSELNCPPVPEDPEVPFEEVQLLVP